VTKTDAELESLRNILTAAHVEIMPIGSIEEHVKNLAAGATVTVTCSPTKGIDATLEAAVLLSELGFDAVPHLAARQIASKSQQYEREPQVDIT